MLTDEDKEWIRAEIDNVLHRYVHAVSDARGRALDEKIRKLCADIDAWRKPE